SSAGGRIAISAGRGNGAHADMVEIAVEDTGTGIPAEDLPRLTERFFRVEKARSRALGGTGLGLAIVKHIVQAHDGALGIDSTLGRGTTVRVQLPAARAMRNPISIFSWLSTRTTPDARWRRRHCGSHAISPSSTASSSPPWSPTGPS